jgi:DNA-binding response OmpR family regulator
MSSRDREGASSSAGRLPRVLVVEDEALVAMLLEDALLDADYAVMGPAATVDEALALLDCGEAPDAAVLDLNLADELVTPVADALAARGVPFVFATGYDRERLAAVLPRRHHGAPVLLKPFGPAELSTLVLQLARPAPSLAAIA